jgi:hypothetical protein
MAKQATHNGTCQLCGALQALPGGRLSQHGYNVRWNSFVGVCPGSKYLPFEQDKTEAEKHVGRVLAQAADLDADADALRASEPVNGQIWVHEYVPAAFGGGGTRIPSRNIWRQVELAEDFSFTKKDGRKERFQAAGVYPKTVAEAARYYTDARAAFLNGQAKNLRDYVKWQQERVAAWTPQPLQPIVRKEKTGPVLHAHNAKYNDWTLCGYRTYSLRGATVKHVTRQDDKVNCPKCLAKRTAVVA